MNKTNLTVVPLISLFMLISLGWADKAEIPLGGAALISNTQAQRMVVKVSLTGLPQHAVVDYAEVRFAQGMGVTAKTMFSLWIQSLTTTWNPASVSWTTPWTSPGGDFSDDAVLGVVRPGEGYEARLDVTRFVRSWLSGTANNGLILRRIPGDNEAFLVDGNVFKNALAQGRLVVHYSPQ